MVVCEKTTGFEPWGSMAFAVLYAAELYIAVGDFEKALDCLNYAFSKFGPNSVHLPPSHGVGLPLDALRPRKAAFEQFLIHSAISKNISGDQFMSYSEFIPSR